MHILLHCKDTLTDWSAVILCTH